MISARTKMSPGAFKRRLATAVMACVACVGAWACSLNPQPIPPGFTDDTPGSDAGRGADVGLGPANQTEGGTGADHDSGAPPPQDAGHEGRDAGDAAADAESDASSDAADGGG